MVNMGYIYICDMCVVCVYIYIIYDMYDRTWLGNEWIGFCTYLKPI